MSVLVSRPAPDFAATAVSAEGQIIEKFHLHEKIKGKEAVLFFYPLDFTFVCPSELIALDKRMAEFKKRNVEVIGVSIDSQFTHIAWRNTPIAKGGIGHVGYTLVADIDHSICQTYGVEHPAANVALRAAFIIDKQGMVKAEIVNDLPIGRNIDEILRLVDAVQFVAVHGEVCPAGWEKGKKSMKPSTEGVAEYLAQSTDEL